MLLARVMLLSWMAMVGRGMATTRALLPKKYILSHAQMKSLMHRVKENNDLGNLRLPAPVKSFNVADHGDDPNANELVPFIVDDKVMGYVSPEFAALCAQHRDVFFIKSFVGLCLVPALASREIEERTAAVARVTLDLKNRGFISGWRNELLPVLESFSDTPALLVERAAYPFFGMKGYGVHVNGFVVGEGEEAGEMRLWVATRSKTKQTWPGMLDHIVAGGQPHGISPTENVVKECGEEAGIPPSLAAEALPVSAVSYTGVDEGGRLKRDCLFCYDLQLPASFIPIAEDGEVESFQLQTMDWVLDKLTTGGPGGYKTNCNLVVIDFLIRHGVIAPESPHYLDLLASLRDNQCS